jgi:hypothetical protein
MIQSVDATMRMARVNCKNAGGSGAQSWWLRNADASFLYRELSQRDQQLRSVEIQASCLLPRLNKISGSG